MGWVEMSTPEEERPMVVQINSTLVGLDGGPIQVVRPMTDEEYAQWLLDQEAAKETQV